jgi:glutamate 5-kinase
MLTKLSAARLAARSGTNTVIANGSEEQVLIRLLQGEALGTLLEADREPVTARKQWLAGQLSLKGKLTLDAGAVEVLQKSGKSLLAVGIQSVQGQFSRGDVVACVDGSGQEIARGLINYDVNEIEKLKGVSSDKIEQLLGYVGEEEVIHRDNMVISDSSSN